MQSSVVARRVVQSVTIGSVVACVYFQASAASALLATAILPPLPDELRTGRSRRPPDARRTLTSESLLDSNAFDWRVDLSPPSDATTAAATPPVSNVDLSNPLLAQVCTHVSVSIVTESLDPRESVSVLNGPDEQEPSQRRVGDRVGDYEVAYIGFNRAKASPAVWLVSSTELCQALLFNPNPVAAPSPNADADGEPSRNSRLSTKGSQLALAPEIAEGITKLSDTQVAVERAVVDQVLRDPSAFMSVARIVPVQDKASGSAMIRLSGVRDGSLLSTLNLKNGDFLASINGFDLGNPEQALSAYARLRTADRLSLEVVRQGKPVTLEVRIQ